MTDHLDGGYAAAARRRAEQAAAGEAPEPRDGRVARAVLAVGLLLVGFLLAVAYRGTLRQAPDSERARQALVRDVEVGSELSDSLQRRAETLSGQLVRERDAALAASRTGDRVSTEVRRLEAAAAQLPVRGPGVQVVVGDASPREQIDPATGERVTVPADDNGRLRDRDLQSLVNALWAAGAEAIAVDGERLAPTTTIRAAGEAILVDLRPVSSPYTIDAVGDPDTLLPRFADSDAARRYQSYTGLYGIQFTLARGDRAAAAGGDRAGAAVRRTGRDAVRGRHAGAVRRVRPTAGRYAVPVRLGARERAVIPALALGVGVLLGLLVEPVVPLWLQPYLPIAVVAALDAVFGGIRARLDGIFDSKVFVVSFVSNVLVAALIVFLGDKLGVGGQLSTGVVVVLGIRIFGNAAAIRRHLFRA